MISLIIPTYNRKGLNEKCFEQALKDRTGLEVIWVDDGSTDGTQESLKQFNVDIAVLNKKNSGIAKSYNQGIKMATGDWIGIMDADFFMPDNWLSKAKEYIEKIPQTDIVGIIISGFERWLGELIKINDVDVLKAKHIMGFFLVSKAFFNKVGYYDEKMGWYALIDHKWSEGAKLFNPTAYFIPGITIQHLGVGEWDSGEYRRRKDEGLNKIKL